MTEPLFICQEPQPQDAAQWIQGKVAEFRERGATYFRVSHNEADNLILMEAWAEQPDDQGPVRWQNSTKV